MASKETKKKVKKTTDEDSEKPKKVKKQEGVEKKKKKDIEGNPKKDSGDAKPKKKEKESKEPKEKSEKEGKAKKKKKSENVDEEPKKKTKKKSSEYEDDFEEYDDDFENETEPTTTTTVTSTVTTTNFTAPTTSIPTEQPRPSLPRINSSGNISMLMRSNSSSNLRVDNAFLNMKAALDKENNEAISKARASSINLLIKPQGITLPDRKFVDPKVGQQLAAARSRWKRGREILELITLDVVGADLFESLPQSEYQIFVRTFNNKTATQTSTQTNEEPNFVETQTEEIETAPKSCQFPDDIGYSGDDFADRLTSAFQYFNIDHSNLLRFLTPSTQVMELLVEENRTSSSHKHEVISSDGTFSKEYFMLPFPSIFLGKPIRDISFHGSLNHLLLTALATGNPRVKEKSPLHGRGIICIWNTDNPMHPHKQLVCESQVTCCLFGPEKANIVLAGTTSGTVVAWDLREKYFWAPNIRKLELLIPCYATDPLFQENHLSSVKCKITLLPQLKDVSSEEVDQSSSSTLFSAATIDEQAIVNIWLVTELKEADWAGSESDFGMRTGSRIKLLKTSTIKLSESIPTAIPVRTLARTETATRPDSLRSYDIQFFPEDINQFIAATDVGRVIRRTRFGNLVGGPSYYGQAYTQNTSSSSYVTSIHFCPLSPSLFFVSGWSDGSLCAFHVESPSPAAYWETKLSHPIIQVIWSKVRHSVIYALSTTCLYIFDLSQNVQKPTVSFLLKGVPVGFSVTQRKNIGNKDPQLLAISFTDGTVQVHTLSEVFSKPLESEDKVVEQLLSPFDK